MGGYWCLLISRWAGRILHSTMMRRSGEIICKRIGLGGNFIFSRRDSDPYIALTKQTNDHERDEKQCNECALKDRYE